MLFVATLVFSASAINLRKRHSHNHLAKDHKVNATAFGLSHGTQRAFDPHCKEGIMNTEMTVCCQADCGECHDGSEICRGDKTGTGRESTCCPSTIITDKVPTCENSMAPCMVPEYIRNPEEQAYGDRHAKDDCNEVKRKTDGQNHASTAFIKFEGKSIGATKACGTTFGTVEQAAAACSSDDECMGFEATPQTDAAPSPGCLFKASLQIESLSDSSDLLYLKREDGYAGHTFKFGKTTFGECTASCGGGVKSPNYACESDAGTTKKLGLCTSLVAMNPDALPEMEVKCGLEECEELESPIGDCAEHLTGCITDIVGTYYNFGDEFGGTGGKWTVCPSSLSMEYPWGFVKYMGWNYYYEEAVQGPGAMEAGHMEYWRGEYYWGYSIPSSELTFACPDEGHPAGTLDLPRDMAEHGEDGYSYEMTSKFHPVVHHACACTKKK